MAHYSKYKNGVLIQFFLSFNRQIRTTTGMYIEREGQIKTILFGLNCSPAKLTFIISEIITQKTVHRSGTGFSYHLCHFLFPVSPKTNMALRLST